MPATQKKPAPREEVELKKIHTHAGEQKQPGDKINVTERQKARLEKRGII